jgi:hypothetical protein
MAAEIQYGKAVVHGITNGGTAISIAGYATFILDSLKGGHKFDLDEVKDELKFDASLIAVNGHLEVTINWKPAGATRAAAAATAVILAPLANVALANFKVAAFNGTWIYVGDNEISLSQSPAGMSIKIRKYDDATQNTSLTTIVTG